VIPTDVLTPLQQAIFARLTGDAALMAVITGVFDGAPEGTAYPYVVLGEVIETPDNAHGAFGADSVVTLHVWSKATGYKEGLEMAAHLRRVLDHQPLTVAGHRVVSVRHEQTLTLRDPDSDLRHIPVRFRVTTEQE
jgi:hypothetical protein